MIRVFPRRTKWTPDDDLAFVGDPPLFRPPDQPVRISVTFSWDISEGQRLYRAWAPLYHDIEIGGPAFGDPGGEFTPGRFLKPGVTITSRGCSRRCPYCFVPAREGRIRELDVKDGWIVQDNNLLACSENHLRRVFEMLRRQRRPIEFKGGLVAALLKPFHVELFDSIRVGELWFACDRAADLPALRRAEKLLKNYTPRQRRCFVLIGFEDKTISEAERRCQEVYDLGYWPFAQLYQPAVRIRYPREWQAVAKKWSRPAAFRSPRSR